MLPAPPQRPTHWAGHHLTFSSELTSVPGQVPAAASLSAHLAGRAEPESCTWDYCVKAPVPAAPGPARGGARGGR